METLADEFADAVGMVTVNGEKAARAQKAHTEVRELLEHDDELRGWGINTILIGSYARKTGRYPGKDVDVFLRFERLTARHDPAKVYDAVKRVLVAKYGDAETDPQGRVTPQNRSLKVDFPDEDNPGGDTSFSIDAVPAVPWGDHWGIPNKKRDLWDDDDQRWIKTNPIKYANDTNTLATSQSSPTVGGANAYRPIVRLLRQVRHVHLGDARPGGLFVEIAAYYAWRDGLVTGTSWAELLTNTLEQVGQRFTACVDTPLTDPVLGTTLKPELDPGQWSAAGDLFTRLAALGRDALASDKCRAAKIWRDILGENERGHVMRIPSGCDAAGFPVGAVTAVSAVGSNDPRGFASHHPPIH